MNFSLCANIAGFAKTVTVPFVHSTFTRYWGEYEEIIHQHFMITQPHAKIITKKWLTYEDFPRVSLYGKQNCFKA